MSEKIAQVKELLNSLTLLEAAELAKQLQDEWGVSAAAPMMAMAGPMPGAAGAGHPGAGALALPGHGAGGIVDARGRG